MERKIFHGNIQPVDVAQALLGEFNRGNLRAQTLGQRDKMIVQVNSRPGAASGGDTAITITIQKMDDGIIVEVGEQAWLGVAASLGVSALAAIRNPFSLLGRLDDIAQDIEHLKLGEKIWQVISKAIRAAGASTELSEKLRRVTCDYCHSANPVGDASCLACGAPLGKAQPTTCNHCGYVVTNNTKVCPNCKKNIGK